METELDADLVELHPGELPNACLVGGVDVHVEMGDVRRGGSNPSCWHIPGIVLGPCAVRKGGSHTGGAHLHAQSVGVRWGSAGQIA